MKNLNRKISEGILNSSFSLIALGLTVGTGYLSSKYGVPSSLEQINQGEIGNGLAGVFLFSSVPLMLAGASIGFAKSAYKNFRGN